MAKSCDGCGDASGMTLYKCTSCVTSDLYCYSCAKEHYAEEHLNIREEFEETDIND